MKRGLTILALLVLIPSLLGAQWQKIAELKGTDGSKTLEEYITCVYFLDLPGSPRIGFVGTASELYRTTNGGGTWLSVWGEGRAFWNDYVSEISFKDSLTGWFTVVGLNNGCYRTNDGGTTWSKLPVPSLAAGGYALHYSSGSGLLLLSRLDTGITATSTMLVSPDLGDSWIVHPEWKSGSFSFSTQMKGIATNYSDISHGILRTTDGGQSWIDVFTPLSCYQPLAIRDTSVCFALAEDSEYVLYRSDDYGASWRRIKNFGASVDMMGNKIAPTPTGVIKGDLSRLYIQTDSGMYISRDEGKTWVGDGGPPYCSLFTDDRFYCAKGVTIAGMSYSQGAVYGGGLWREDWAQSDVKTPSSANTDISVTENPFEIQTTLHFTLSEAAYTKVDVLDVLGREVAVVGTGRILNPGEHQLPVDLSGNTAGTYYLRISLGTGEVRTMKLVKR